MSRILRAVLLTSAAAGLAACSGTPTGVSAPDAPNLTGYALAGGSAEDPAEVPPTDPVPPAP